MELYSDFFKHVKEFDILKYVLLKKIAYNKPESEFDMYAGFTPLHLAIKKAKQKPSNKGYLDLVKLILEKASQGGFL